ncbi:hypothetical protein B0919_09415 [Hymenobacter sp. CRA2]|nr:hypothetical protein B0919_09415 [Hymenobacter sp. CRA2]
MPEFKAQLTQCFPAFLIEHNASGDLIIEAATGHVYINQPDSEVDIEAAQLIYATLSNPIIYHVPYRGLGLLKQALTCIGNRDKLLIDNNFGTLLRGHEFVKKLVNQPNWKWCE